MYNDFIVSTSIHNNWKLYQIDIDGYLINPASKILIKNPWTLLIHEFIEICTDALNENCHSIYVIGSVATGNAVKGISDLDLVIVSFETVSIETKEHIQLKTKSLKNNHSFVTKISVDYLEHNFIDKSLYSNAKLFYLKTNGACIYGNSILDELPKYRPNKHLAQFLTKSFESKLERSLEAIKNCDNEISLAKEYRFLAKHIIRTSFAICIPAKKIFTTDLYTCCDVFATCYPKYSEDINFFYKILNEPLQDKETVLSKTQDFGNILALLIKNILKLDFWLRLTKLTRNEISVL